MKIEIAKAGIEYKSEILELLTEFYGTDMETPLAKKLSGTLTELLNYPKYGNVFIIKSGVDIIGYLILTFGYSIEHGGRDAFIDEFYIKENYRNKGIGKEALDYIIKYARTTGIKALHLQVKEKHKAAANLYVKSGFTLHDGSFMTVKLN
jgi:GNAT superfamily N-acetyltransferase